MQEIFSELSEPSFTITSYVTCFPPFSWEHWYLKAVLRKTFTEDLVLNINWFNGEESWEENNCKKNEISKYYPISSYQRQCQAPWSTLWRLEKQVKSTVYFQGDRTQWKDNTQIYTIVTQNGNKRCPVKRISQVWLGIQRKIITEQYKTLREETSASLGLGSRICPMWAVWSGADHLTTRIFSFLISKLGLITASVPLRILWERNKIIW